MIGAGMAGLAAAARLATRDNSVILCEASQAVGGALGGWQHDDLIFDTGAYTLTLPAVYRDLFIKTGSRKKSAAATLEDRVDLQPLDPVRRYLFPDGTRLDLPNASLGRLRAAFDDALGPGAGDAWCRVIDHGSLVWDTIRPALVDAPGSGGRELVQLARTSRGRRALTPGRSLHALAGRWFRGGDSWLFLLLDDYARQAGADPQRAPGVLAMHVYIEHAFGAWRIGGGLHTLAEALHQRVIDRGVEVRLGARVARIETGGADARSGAGAGAVTGVTLADGERLAADVVVAAVDQVVLAGLLGVSASSGQSSADSYSATVTTLCLEIDDPPAMPHETVLLNERDPALRIHVRQEQPTAWTVHADGVQEAGDMLAALARRGIDVRDKVRVQHVITGADRAAATGVPGGAAYGPAANGLRSALLRSAVTQDAPGLYHVGASARPGAGLPFVALSAWQAAELIRGRAKSEG